MLETSEIDKEFFERYTLHNDDCLSVLREIPDNSVDAVVTDPPYGLSDHKQKYVQECLDAWINDKEYLTKNKGFMGRSWDSWVPGPEVWKEVYRVLKPGGHALIFAGSRSQDLMGIAIRLAGFEYRDNVQWVYGSGFPKSMDVSKALDKQAGVERTEVVGVKPGHEGFVGRDNLSSVQSLKGTLGGDGGFARPWMDDPEAVDRYHMQMAPATEAAKQYDGYGTALKPAYEPIILARKPLEGTVAQNVLKHGVGGLNIDGCRVETKTGELKSGTYRRKVGAETVMDWARDGSMGKEFEYDGSKGRFPANLIHDGSDEVLACFPESKSCNSPSNAKPESKYRPGQGNYQPQGKIYPGDTGSAARFFKACPDDDPEDSETRRLIYCAKASKKDRNDGLDGKQAVHRLNENNQTDDHKLTREGLQRAESEPKKNHHPTVKPTELMRYLVRLVASPGNPVILDPFMGSGSTGKAAMLEGVRFIGIERESDYFEIAQTRIEAACNNNQENHKDVDEERSLFEDMGDNVDKK